MHGTNGKASSLRDARGLSGIMLGLSVFLMLAHIVAAVVLGNGRVSTILILVYGVSAGLAGAALYISFRRHDTVLAMFIGHCISGHGLLIVLAAVALLAGLGYPGEFALYGAEPNPVTGAASLTELIMDKTGKSAYLILGLGLSMVGLFGFLTDALPRWIGWLGLGTGISGFTASLLGLADVFGPGTTEIIVGISYLTCLAFMSILSIRLVSPKREKPALDTLGTLLTSRPPRAPQKTQ